MASLHRHCARARSLLPSKTTTTTSSLRSRSLYTTARLYAEEDENSSGSRNSAKSQLKGTSLNQAAYNAIKSDSPKDAVRNTVSRFVNSGSKPSRPNARPSQPMADSSGVTDARALASNNAGSGGQGGPMIVRRRLPPRSGGQNRGSAPASGGGGGGGGFKSRSTGGPRSANAGGGRGGGPQRRRGRGLNAVSDESTEAELAEEEMLDENFEGDFDASEFEVQDFDVEAEAAKDKSSRVTASVQELVETMKTDPAAVRQSINDLDFSPAEKEYLEEQLAEHEKPNPFNPGLKAIDLQNYSVLPVALGSASNPLVGDGLSQLLGRMTPIDGVPSNRQDERTIARSLALGDQGVVIPEGTDTSKNIKEDAVFWAERERAKLAKQQGKAIDEIELGPHELKSLEAKDRKIVNDQLIAGKYVPFNAIVPNSAGPIVKEVSRIIAKNHSYSTKQSKDLSRIISGLLPAVRAAKSTTGGSGNGNGKPAASTGGKTNAAANGKAKSKA